jgi:hypothetical protein
MALRIERNTTVFSHINFAPKWMDEELNGLTIATANVGV